MSIPLSLMLKNEVKLEQEILIILEFNSIYKFYLKCEVAVNLFESFIKSVDFR